MEKPRKIGLTILILIELFPLLYYKYTNFAIDILNSLLQTNFAPSELLLPIGISFYSFQAISYTIDVYKEKFPKTTGFLDYCFFLTFFPLLIADLSLVPKSSFLKSKNIRKRIKASFTKVCG